MVMVLVPATSGTLAIQLAVPAALPEAPTELLQVTEVVSAEAVPPIAMPAAEVETTVSAGEVIFNAGGAVGAGGLAGGGADEA